jgi:hypothetical protein
VPERCLRTDPKANLRDMVDILFPEVPLKLPEVTARLRGSQGHSSLAERRSQ